MITLTVEDFQFKDLKDGNPVQLRTNVSATESGRVKKGDHVQVTCHNSKLEAAIISEPMTVRDLEKGGREVSLEVSKVK